MHWTLNPTKGVGLALLSAATAGVFAWLARPFPTAQLIIGPAAGLAIGVLQRRSLRDSPAPFRSARTAIEVRKAFSATNAGKNAIRLQYVAAAALAAVSVGYALAQTTEAPRNPMIGFAAGYFVLMFVRDLTALPAVRDLHAESDSERPGAAP